MKTILLSFMLTVVSISSYSQNYEWAKNLGGPGVDRAQCVETDAAGNVYVAGAFRDSMDADPGAGVFKLVSNGMLDAFLAKYTENGDFVWAFSFGDIYDDEFLDIKIDNEGNLITTGSFMETIDLDPGPGTYNVTSVWNNNDGFLAKYTASGSFTWGFSFGSAANDYGKHIQINAANDIYLAGYFNQSVDFDPGAGNTSLNGTFDIFIAKYDKNANFLWVFKIGANGSENDHGMALDVNENVLVFGRFQQTVDFDPGNGTANLTASSNHDLFFAKYTKSGNFVWAKQLSGPSSKYGKGISTDADSNIYISGSFGNSLDMDPSGNTINATSPGVSPFAAKYDAAGDYQWHTVFSSPGGNAEAGGISYYSGNVYIIGTYSSSMNVSVGGNPVNLTSTGNEDFFVSKLDESNGNIVWINSLGGADLDYGNDIKVLNNDVFYICGIFNGTCDFNFDTQNTNNLVSTGTHDAFFAKYDIFGVGIHENWIRSNDLKIYPNPVLSRSSLQIASNNLMIEEVSIFDIAGRMVLNEKLNFCNSTSIQISLNSGYYILSVKTEEGFITKSLEIIY
ncbi:MAG: T9SS type A sorting domain-containing protein [Flavobacteriales bacterium]|nr:T9SS type A sorting domain-containing protein [Flavobacteriales bacterium]